MVCANNPCQSPPTSSPTQDLPISFDFSLESRDARAPSSASVARDPENEQLLEWPSLQGPRQAQPDLIALDKSWPSILCCKHRLCASPNTPSDFGALHLVLNLRTTI